MAITIPNLGEATFLRNILGVAAAQTIVYRLYTNDYTITESSTAADLTECSGGGYAPITLAAGSWTITEANPSTAVYPQIQFSFTSVPTTPSIYGYYATQATSGILLWGERFPSAPFQIQSASDNIKITTTLNLTEP